MKVVDHKSTIKWYDNNAQTYASNIEPYISENVANKFIESLKVNRKVLDAGCAAGRDSRYFSSKGLEVTGVDLSEELLKIAKEKVLNANFLKADFRNLPFSDLTFGGVWSAAALVHMDKLEDTKSALKEFYRVLTKDGLLFVSVKTSKKETDIVNDRLSGHDRFFRYYTKSQLIGILTKIGFKVDSVEVSEDNAGREDVKWLSVFAHK